MASYFEANNQQSLILRMTLEYPRRGCWFAEGEIEAGIIPPIGTQCKITVMDQQWIGRCLNGGNWHNKACLRVAGGLGDLSSPVKAKQFQQVPVRLVVQYILEACKMTLADPSQSILDARLTAWVVMAGRASDALSLVLAAVKQFYRVTEDGKIGVYEFGRTYAQAVYIKNEDFLEMDVDPIKTRYMLAPNLKLVTHSKSFIAQDADIITHHIDSTQIRTMVHLSHDTRD